MKENQTIFEERSGELEALLEDVLTQIQELREEFTSTLDDIEDMITSTHAGSTEKDVVRTLCQETFAA